MRKSFKTLVRAISPFTRKGKEQEVPQEEEPLEWDLTHVDIKHALKLFYKKYNPEKAFIVNEILSKYVGDEGVLLGQLCERYHLTKDDMQHFLDQAPQKGQGRKGSSMQGSPNDHRNIDSFDDIKRKKNDSPWDLTDVDVGQALKLIYKKYNPQKTPNLAALADKSENDIVVLLKQLSKRHDLDEDEVQSFLNQAKQKGAHSKQGGVKLDDFETNSIQDNKEVRKVSSSHSKEVYKRNENAVKTSLKDARQGSFSSLRNRGADMETPKENIGKKGKGSFLEDYLDDEEHEQEEEEGEIHSIDNPLSPPPPPPNSNWNHRNQSEAENNYEDEDINRLSEDLSRSKSFDNLRPKLADGKRYTISNVLKEMKSNSNNFKPFNASREMNQNSNTIDDENDIDMDQFEEQKLPPAPARSTSISHATKEVGTLKTELANARKHIQDMNNESRAVLHLLKNNDSKSSLVPQKSVVTTESKAIQVEDNSLKVEINRLKMKVKAAEDQYIQLEVENNNHKTNFKDLEKSVKTLQKHLKISQADKSDLLQLINILSAAPIPAKNVLESYLTKVAGNAPKGSFLREKVFESKSQFMGDRVDALLQWKRSNEPNENEEEDFQDGEETQQNNEKGGDTTTSEILDSNEHDDGNDMIDNDEMEIFDGYDEEQNMELLMEEVDENVDNTLNLISPQERKIYENINIGKQKGSKVAKSQFAAKNSDSAQFQIDANGGSTVSSYSDYGDDGNDQISLDEENNKKSKQELLQDQYALAKKYYQHQQSQNKLAEQIAKGNLDLQVKENQRLKQQAATGQNPLKKIKSATGMMDSTDSNSFVMATTNKSPFADESNMDEVQEDVIESASVSSIPKNKTTRTSDSSNNNLNTTTNTVNPTPQVFTNADWMECYDPKSQRKYYYNRVLKKSTWIKPPELVDPNESNTEALPAAVSKLNDHESKSNTKAVVDDTTKSANHRSPSPMQARNVLGDSGTASSSAVRSSSAPPGRLRATNNATQQQQQLQQSTAPVRSSTPSLRADRSATHLNPTVSSTNSKYYTNNNTNSATTNNTNGSIGGGETPTAASGWVTAVDPKTQRKYWYNRETKVSTWRKPVDLI